LPYTDHHVHTYYSPDSQADVKSYILKAKSMELDFVMFTDHVDFGTTDPDFKDHIDYGEYYREMKALEDEFGLPVQVGVEIGYEKNHESRIEDVLGKYPFDFVIASIHCGDGKDFHLGDFFRHQGQMEAYNRYFELLQEMVENFNSYDVVGHFDYIVRYGPCAKKDYDFDRFSGIIQSIFKQLIEKGKGIEVNTSGLRGPYNTLFPKREALASYRNLGGEIITIGSDAHFNEHYAFGIPDALDILRAIGYKEISSFTARREHRIKI
jgi:histidinol-phosphatase (PHP family)